MLTEKWQYLQESKKYLKSVMLSMKQEDLVKDLSELNYNELKMAHGAGVPGDAWLYSFRRLKELRGKLNEYIEHTGTEAKFSVEVPTDEEADKDGEAGV